MQGYTRGYWETGDADEVAQDNQESEKEMTTK